MNQQDAGSDGEPRREGILVPEHLVPVPRTISEQAQAFLSQLPPFESRAVPDVDDIEGWRRYREAGQEGVILASKHYAERYPGTVTTHHVNEISLYEIEPDNLDERHRDHAIIYIHGGGFVTGDGEAAIYPAMHVAGLSGTRVYSIDYRLAPESPFPIPLDDTLDGYRFVLERHQADNVALFGLSAGANLAVTVTLKARDERLPLPKAVAVHSCPSDLIRWCDSYHTLYMVDSILKEHHPKLFEAYVQDHNASDPLVSPVFADFASGFPPCVLTSGTRDLLLSPTVMLHRTMVSSGVQAQLHIWEAMTHAPFFSAPEENEFYGQHIKFMHEHLCSS